MSKRRQKKNRSEQLKKNKRPHNWWTEPSRQFEIGLLVLAFAIRLVYLLQVRDNPLFDNPAMDPAYHLRWARSILDGEFWGTSVYFRAPFYPYLLALFHALTGGDLFIMRLGQHLIGVFTVWGIYRLARTAVSESAAKVAGLAAASYVTLIYFENELLLDFLLLPWMLFIFYAFGRAQQSGKNCWLITTGLAIGLFAITRPNILLCWPVLAVAVWFWVRSDENIVGHLKKLALLALGTVIPILPVTVHNWAVGDEFVLISSQGGINFYLGNNSEADGVSASMPEPWGHTWKMADVKQHAEDEVGRELTYSELSGYWRAKALSWWADDPAAALKLTLKKTVLLFTNTEIANNQNIRHAWRTYTPVTRFLPLTFGVLAALGLVGLFMAAPRHRLVKLMLWVGLFYALSVIAFFVPARFRLPLLPFLFVGFGVFVEQTYRGLVEGRSRQVISGAVIATLLLVFSFVPWYKTQPETDAQAVFQLGNAALRKGDLEQAAEHFRQTLIVHPNYEGAHLNLGVVHLRQGDLEKAAVEFEAEVAAYPESGKSYANLCSIRAVQKRYIEAEQYAAQALNYEPGNPTALVNLAHIYWTSRRYAQAARLLEASPEIVRTSPIGRNALGGSYVHMGRFDEAMAILGPLAKGDVNLAPGLYISDGELEELGYNDLSEYRARANYNLGWLATQQRDLDRAMAHYKRAIEFLPDFGEALANLGAAYIERKKPDSALVSFTAAVQTAPRKAGYIYNVGIAHLHLGDTATAINQFERALAVDSTYSFARRKLASLGL